MSAPSTNAHQRHKRSLDDLMVQLTKLTLGDSESDSEVRAMVKQYKNEIEFGINSIFHEYGINEVGCPCGIYRADGSTEWAGFLPMRGQLEHCFRLGHASSSAPEIKEFLASNAEFLRMQKHWIDVGRKTSDEKSIASMYLELARFFAEFDNVWEHDYFAKHMAHFFLDLAESAHLRHVEAETRFLISKAKKLGEGGFGKVWGAVHRYKGDTSAKDVEVEVAVEVAVKEYVLVYSRDNESGPTLTQQREWIQKEIDALCKHENPLIPKVHWSRCTRFYNLLAMEKYSGDTLQSYIDDRRNTDKIRLENLPALMRSIAASLAVYKDLGIVHHDVKPSNIMFKDSAQSFPKTQLVDFGLAGEPRSTACSFRGTPGYAAPEQSGNKPYERSWRIDIYSAGVTFFSFAMGPSRDNSFASLFPTGKVNLKRAETLLQRRGVSNDLTRIIISMIDKTPSRRPCPEMILYDPALANAINPLQDLYAENKTCALVNEKSRNLHLESVIAKLKSDCAKEENRVADLEKRICESRVGSTPISVNAKKVIVASVYNIERVRLRANRSNASGASITLDGISTLIADRLEQTITRKEIQVLLSKFPGGVLPPQIFTKDEIDGYTGDRDGGCKLGGGTAMEAYFKEFPDVKMGKDKNNIRNRLWNKINRFYWEE